MEFRQGSILGSRIAGLAVVAVLLLPGSAAAIPYVVVNDADSGAGTLREKITLANASPGVPDTITFNIPSFDGAITLASSLPSISDNLEIQGPGAGLLTIDGNQAADTVLSNGGGAPVTKVSGLTVKGGRNDVGTNYFSAGIQNFIAANLTLNGVTVTQNVSGPAGPDPATTSQVFGAGINNNGTLTLNHSNVTANQAVVTVDGNFAANVFGAGITNSGGSALLFLNKSTVSGNIATASAPDPMGDASVSGAGIANISGGTVTIDRSTVSGNSATASAADGDLALGSGIYQGGTALFLTSSTIAANSATAPDFAIANLYRANGTASVKNTLVASAPAIQNCGPPPFATTTLGHNLESPTDTCGFSDGTDQRNVPNPGIGGLGSNGGPSETIALLPGTPAIDRGIASAGETTDQRDLGRPSDFPDVPNLFGSDGTDIGAFELQFVPPAPPAATPATGRRAAALKKCKKKKSKKARRKCRKRAKKLPV